MSEEEEQRQKQMTEKLHLVGIHLRMAGNTEFGDALVREMKALQDLFMFHLDEPNEEMHDALPTLIQILEASE